MVVAVLVQICSLLEDSENLRACYGLEQEADIQADASPQSTFDREIRRQSTLVFWVQKSCALLRKVRWTVHDRSKFADLVKELTAFNDVFYQLRPVNIGASLTATMNAEMLARAMFDDGYPGVQALMQAAMSEGSGGLGSGGARGGRSGSGGSGSGESVSGESRSEFASGAGLELGQVASAHSVV